MTSYPPPSPGANPPPPPGAPGQQPYGTPPQPYGAPPQPYGAPPRPYGAPAQQYGAPAQQQPYGTPPQQQYGAPTPPPYVPADTQATKAPVVAWLVPLAALLAVIGMFTPWFRAKATASADGRTLHHTFDGLYSFKDGKLGLLAPILLVVLAIGVVGLLVGKTPARFAKGGAHPVASAGKASAIVGGISLLCAVIAWFLVKSQYKFTEGGKKYGWDEYIKLAKDSGIKLELSRGPQIGYFLTIAAAVLAIVAGVLMILAARNASTTPAAYPPAGAAQGYQPAPAGYAPTPGYPPAGPPAGDQGPPPASLQK